VEPTPEHVLEASAWLVGIARRVPPGRWEAEAEGSTWSARRTVDHCVDTLLLYSTLVASRATGRLRPPRNGDPEASPSQLVDVLGASAAVLAEVLRCLPAGTRAFHPSGLADRSGWAGMACTELLVHGSDLARATAVPLEAPVELAAVTVRRVLPWAAADGEGDGWQQLLWATGRAPLGQRPAEAADWWWQSAPLDEWDGRPRRRTAPPQW
jgi:hypothetical protein